MAKLEDVLPALREGKKITRLSWGWAPCVDILNNYLEIPDKESILADDWIVLEDYQILNRKLDKALSDIRFIIDNECDELKTKREFNSIIKEIEELIPEEVL
jgi:hypothetical protein